MGKKRYPADTILFGHSISDPAKASPYSAERRTSVAPADLAAVLEKLVGRCHLTFDDGYLDNLTVALPILERYDRAATVFVTTGFVDDTVAPLERVLEPVVGHHDATARRLEALGITDDAPADRHAALWDNLRLRPAGERVALQRELLADCGLVDADLTVDYLDLEQLRELAAHPLITIGAHTRTHPDLRVVTDDELVDELAGARRQLEDWLDQPIDEVAYPYGYVDTRVRRAAARAGYRRGYTTEILNWRGRVPIYRRLDLPRIDLTTAARRLHRRQASCGAKASI